MGRAFWRDPRHEGDAPIGSDGVVTSIGDGSGTCGWASYPSAPTAAVESPGAG